VYAQDIRLRQVIDQIGSGTFSPDEPDRHRPIVKSLLQGDRYLVLADFAAYMAAQEEVEQVWREPALWTKRAIRNIAGMGRFSSDRAIREYAARIWNVRTEAH
jgi:starch phosphorylase